jgi:hypothetical protein
MYITYNIQHTMKKNNDQCATTHNNSNKFAAFSKNEKKDTIVPKDVIAKPKVKKNFDNAGFVEVKEKQKREKENKEDPIVVEEKKKPAKTISIDETPVTYQSIARMTNQNLSTSNIDSTRLQSVPEEVDGNSCYLNTQWTVWIHRNDCPDWTESSFKSIFVIDSIGSFWRFFNSFHNLNKEDNQFFIMRNKIKPIWEDNNNRNGGLCSLKMDCYDKNGKIDIGCEPMMVLCLLAMNETLLPDNNEINGISYSIRNRSVLIKIWSKDFKYDIVEKLPKNLINKFSNVIKNNVPFKKNDSYVSIRYLEIKPEYNL